MFAGGAASSKPIKNRTELYPNASDVFKVLVDKIIFTKYRGWIHFNGPKRDAWVAVANEPYNLVLVFCHPFKTEKNRTFQEIGVSIPGIWRLAEWSPKRLGGLLGGSAMLSVPRDQTAELIAFIDNLFVKFYGCGQDYKVSGYSENI